MKIFAGKVTGGSVIIGSVSVVGFLFLVRKHQD